MGAVTRHRWIRLTGCGLVLLAACAVTWVLAVRLSAPAAAQGIPVTEPLAYSGLLADAKGLPLSGKHQVKVALLKTAGGAELCASKAQTLDLTASAGRFRVVLPGSCVTVVSANSDLLVQVTVDGKDKLMRKLSAVPYAVEASGTGSQPDCPRGYSRTSKAGATPVVCARGADEMVRVGDFWIDRYEASVVNKDLYAGGKCNGTAGTAQQYGAAKDDYPVKTFPDSGDWTAPLFACSVKGRTPSHWLTWYQALQVCVAAGKHLCTNTQWQVAVAGTHDAGSQNGNISNLCNTNSVYVRDTGKAGSTPGGTKSCVSNWGAEDMIGNLDEWVAMLARGGRYDTKKGLVDGRVTSLWGAGYGDGKDVIYNGGGAASNGTAWVNGHPAAAIRGGSSGATANAGAFFFNLSASPVYSWPGARCCIREGR